MTTDTRTDALPLDWDKWRTEWADWLQRNQGEMHYLRSSPFKGKNFLADQILGVWRISGRTVELCEMTFPNLEDRDERGMLIREERRRIGVTFADGETAVVGSFAALEKVLGI